MILRCPKARAIAKGEGRHVDHARHKGLRGCHKGVPPRGPLQTCRDSKRSRVWSINDYQCFKMLKWGYPILASFIWIGFSITNQGTPILGNLHMLQTQQALPRSHPVPHWAGSPHNWPGKPTPSFETSSQIFNLNHEFMTKKKQKDPKSAVSPLKLGNLRYLFTKTWDFTSLTNQNREISGEFSFCQGLSGTAHTTPRGNVEGEGKSANVQWSLNQHVYFQR